MGRGHAHPLPPKSTAEERGETMAGIAVDLKQQRKDLYHYRQAPWKGAELVAIKAIHSLIYFTLEFCVGYLLYSGLTKRQDRTTAIAAAAIGAESLIYFGNGRRCPLTGLAEGLGAARGSVTDIYLPRWLAARIFTIHAPLVVVAVFLHVRLLLHRSQAAHRE